MTKRSIKTPTIIDVIRNRHLFGSLPAFQSLATWKAWGTWLKAVFAIPMMAEELSIYRQSTGRTEPPSTQPTEVYSIVGRRGGKSFISSLTAVFLACFKSYEQYLNAGERAAILILARDRDQAKIVFNYVSGIIHAVAALNQMIAVERADEIELDNGVIIMVKTSDYRAIRGLTVAAAILDEIAFWDSEGSSPDHEVLTALRPATSTIPGAKLISISTPYSQSGSLYEQHRDHYGQDNDHVLVWQAETRMMNPTIDEGLIQRELEADPDAAKAEWLAEFRTDLQAAFSPEALEACTVKGRVEMLPSPIIPYVAFTDPSGGRSDSFTLAIGHEERNVAVLDLLEAWKAPFDPGVVVSEAAETLKHYGVLSVTGDRFAAEWPISAFRTHGIAYEQCEKVKSDLYLSLVPTVNSKLIEFLDSRHLIGELRRLERKRGRLGKDSIDHPPRLHDDLANAVAGLAYLLSDAEGNRGDSGFNPQKHIAQEELVAACYEPVYVGLTLTSPIASVIGQAHRGGIEVYACFSSNAGLRDHLERHVQPWLRSHAPWASNNWQKLFGSYNDDIELQARISLAAIIEEILPGDWQPAEVPIEARREAMLLALQKAQGFTFKPSFQVSPGAALIAPALSRPYDPKEKSIYSAIVNALSLLVSRISLCAPSNEQIKVISNYDR
jgi:hypothetical protein